MQGVVTASIVGSKDTSGLTEALSRSPLTLLNAESCDWNSCCYQISFSVFEGRDYWGVIYLDRGQKLHQFCWSGSSAWHQVKTWVKHFQRDFTRNVKFSQSWNIFDKLTALCSTSWNLLWSGFPAFYTAKAQRSVDLSIWRSLWRGQLKASLCFIPCSNKHGAAAEVS